MQGNVSQTRLLMQSASFAELIGDAFFALELAKMKLQERQANDENVTSEATAVLCTFIVEAGVIIGSATQPPTDKAQQVLKSLVSTVD